MTIVILVGRLNLMKILYKNLSQPNEQHTWPITSFGASNSPNLYPNLSCYLKRSFLIAITFLTVISHIIFLNHPLHYNSDFVSINSILVWIVFSYGKD